MKVLQTGCSLLGVALLMVACNNVDFKKTTAGVPYKVLGSSKGDSIKVGNVIRFHQVVRLVRKGKQDSLMNSTYAVNQPQFMQVQAPQGAAQYADLAANVSEAIRRAHKGDSVQMVFSADSILKTIPKEMAGQVPFKKGEEINVTIKVLDVYKTPEEAQAVMNKDRVAGAADRERQMLEQMRKDTAFQSSISRDSKIIEAHLASKGVTASKTDMGVYVQTIQAGQGPKPAAGQYANIKYRGTDLAGKKFDEGTFPMQLGMGGSIPGFENGVKQFSKGGKGVIYIPSALGYGVQGQPPVIQPNQVLVFEIEMLDISDKPIQPAGQPVPQGHSKDDGHGH